MMLPRTTTLEIFIDLRTTHSTDNLPPKRPPVLSQGSVLQRGDRRCVKAGSRKRRSSSFEGPCRRIVDVNRDRTCSQCLHCQLLLSSNCVKGLPSLIDPVLETGCWRDLCPGCHGGGVAEPSLREAVRLTSTGYGWPGNFPACCRRQITRTSLLNTYEHVTRHDRRPIQTTQRRRPC